MALYSAAANRARSFLLYGEAVFFLLFAWTLLRVTGLRCLRWRVRKGENCTDAVSAIYSSVWKVSQWMPISCNCLEVALGVRFMSAVHGMDSTMIVGVHGTPFVAHAWIVSGSREFGVIDSNNYTTLLRL